ncbi:MAG: hypothetical protein K9H16_07535 [Bacteroidales bacterium]|nr:hypothetical protein [Bacteroidales bacterium]
MKLRFIILFAIAAMFTFQSCDENLLDITEEFYYETEMQVFTTDSVMMVAELVDMTDESTIINDYKDKIQTVEITQVKYWVTVHEGDEDQEIIDASLKVAAADGSSEELIASLQNQVLNNIIGEENAQSLTVQQTGVDQMANLIKNDPYTFKLIYNTACNKAPLNFTIRFQFKVKMVANPL